jgi:prophage antirepressor-like protein
VLSPYLVLVDMSNIILFQFESNEIRFVEGLPVANDVATALGYSDPAATISKKVSPQNKTVANLVTPGGIQEAAVLKESGIYQLIFASKLKSAEKFQDWVFSVVLPSIRKTGSYSIAPQPLPRQLPPVRDTIEYIQASKDIADIVDPILKSYLLQSLYEDIGASKALPPSDDVLVVAAVKARSLGFTLKPGEDSKLGKWVAKHCNPLGKTQHGRYEVNVYRDDDRLVETIGAFFG